MQDRTEYSDPFSHFRAWFAEAAIAEPSEPNAMTLATSTADGAPSARAVLLKDWDETGFVFYTNTHSRKGAELAANPQVALLFYWKSLRRQVRIEGRAAAVSAAEADAYFVTRPRISRLGAWASAQSRPLAGRAELEQALAGVEAKYPGEAIPRPPHWSGYRVAPVLLEFWQEMPFRLHDRMVYTRQQSGWTAGRLFP
jgi:pyridoxamine 5'-phosphate oxidase